MSAALTARLKPLKYRIPARNKRDIPTTSSHPTWHDDDMDVKRLGCLILTHRWKQQHLDGQTVVLVCRHCGTVKSLADRPMGGSLGGGHLGGGRLGGGGFTGGGI